MIPEGFTASANGNNMKAKQVYRLRSTYGAMVDAAEGTTGDRWTPSMDAELSKLADGHGITASSVKGTGFQFLLVSTEDQDVYGVRRCVGAPCVKATQGC